MKPKFQETTGSKQAQSEFKDLNPEGKTPIPEFRHLEIRLRDRI